MRTTIKISKRLNSLTSEFLIVDERHINLKNLREAVWFGAKRYER